MGNDFLNALAAFLPIGLFLAAIPPNLITISTKKKRSVGDELETTMTYPFMERIEQIGFNQLMSNVDCQKQLFCDMSISGQDPQKANKVQKVFNTMTALLSTLALLGLTRSSQVIEASQQGNCARFKCY